MCPSCWNVEQTVQTIEAMAIYIIYVCSQTAGMPNKSFQSMEILAPGRPNDQIMLIRCYFQRSALDGPSKTTSYHTNASVLFHGLLLLDLPSQHTIMRTHCNLNEVLLMMLPKQHEMIRVHCDFEWIASDGSSIIETRSSKSVAIFNLLLPVDIPKHTHTHTQSCKSLLVLDELLPLNEPRLKDL